MLGFKTSKEILPRRYNQGTHQVVIEPVHIIFRDEQLAFIEERTTRLEARDHVMKVLNKHAEISVGEEQEEEEQLVRSKLKN